MRILLEMPHPGFLRLHAQMIEVLARRNTVLMAYDAFKYRPVDADRLEALDGVEVVESVPDRTGFWAPVADHVRLGVDYAHYLDPRFAEAPWLRSRMEKFLPALLGPLADRETMGRRRAAALTKAFGVLEDGIGPDPAKVAYLEQLAPDVVVVTPLVTRGPNGVLQRDTVKAAQALGIPVGAAIGSWDHLTSKGLMSVIPDRVFVWNEQQRREAMEIHRVPRDRIVITGAPAFDHWFDRQPTRERGRFLSALHLDGEGPMLLYVGSSPNICQPEVEVDVVRQWLSAIRSSPDPLLGSAGVVIRPHPGNMEHWATVDLSEFPRVAVFPRERPDLLMTTEQQADYFDSLHHSTAVVGVNTSAMVEAAIVGRTVHSWHVPEFGSTQQGTLHFQLLLPGAGGPVVMAPNLTEHLINLEIALREPSQMDGALRAFVESFVRPRGLHRRPSGILAKAIERLADESPGSTPRSRLAPVAHAALVGGIAVASRRPGAAEARARADRKLHKVRARRAASNRSRDGAATKETSAARAPERPVTKPRP